MPEIPQINQTQNLEYTSPITLNSPEDAGLIGKGLYRTGQALTNAAVSIDEINSRKNNAKRALDQAESHANSDAASQEIEQNVIRTGAPDGSDWVEKYKQEFSKVKSNLSKKYKGDALTEEATSTAMQKVENDTVQRLYLNAAKTNQNYMIDGTLTLSNNLSSNVMNNPNSYDSSIEVLENYLQEGVNTNLLDRSAQKKIRKDGIENIIKGNVLGMVNRGEFRQAEEFIRVKASKEISSDSIEKLNNIISTAEYHLGEKRAKADIREDRLIKKTLEETQLKAATQLGALRLSADTPEKVDAFEREALRMLGKKMITRDQYHEAKELDKDMASPPHEETTILQYQIRATEDNPDYRKLRRDVIKDKGIADKNKYKLLSFLDSKEDKEKSDPLVSKEWSAGMMELSSRYDPENKWANDPARLLQKSNALREVIRLNRSGKSVTESFKTVMGKKFGPSSEGVPGVSFDNSNDINYLNQLTWKERALFNAGQSRFKTMKEFENWLAPINRQRDYLNSKRERGE